MYLRNTPILKTKCVNIQPRDVFNCRRLDHSPVLRAPSYNPQIGAALDAIAANDLLAFKRALPTIHSAEKVFSGGGAAVCTREHLNLPNSDAPAMDLRSLARRKLSGEIGQSILTVARQNTCGKAWMRYLDQPKMLNILREHPRTARRSSLPEPAQGTSNRLSIGKTRDKWCGWQMSEILAEANASEAATSPRTDQPLSETCIRVGVDVAAAELQKFNNVLSIDNCKEGLKNNDADRNQVPVEPGVVHPILTRTRSQQLLPVELTLNRTGSQELAIEIPFPTHDTIQHAEMAPGSSWMGFFNGYAQTLGHESDLPSMRAPSDRFDVC